jgi:hypothetical protein
LVAGLGPPPGSVALDDRVVTLDLLVDLIVDVIAPGSVAVQIGALSVDQDDDVGKASLVRLDQGDEPGQQAEPVAIELVGRFGGEAGSHQDPATGGDHGQGVTEAVATSLVPSGQRGAVGRLVAAVDVISYLT